MKFHECRLVRMFKWGQTNDIDATIQLHNRTASEITMKVSASTCSNQKVILRNNDTHHFIGGGVKLSVCEIHHEL
jgi:hypothetical protein